MRVLWLILMSWVALSVIASVIVARAFAVCERALVPVRNR
jgi:hypothetical protein